MIEPLKVIEFVLCAIIIDTTGRYETELSPFTRFIWTGIIKCTTGSNFTGFDPKSKFVINIMPSLLHVFAEQLLTLEPETSESEEFLK